MWRSWLWRPWSLSPKTWEMGKGFYSLNLWCVRSKWNSKCVPQLDLGTQEIQGEREAGWLFYFARSWKQTPRCHSLSPLSGRWDMMNHCCIVPGIILGVPLLRSQLGSFGIATQNKIQLHEKWCNTRTFKVVAKRIKKITLAQGDLKLVSLFRPLGAEVVAAPADAFAFLQ